jgi:hypothetical protein
MGAKKVNYGMGNEFLGWKAGGYERGGAERASGG